ncbi:MAG: adenylate kinase [Eubacteriales bacterium]|nr:adenylate kinase [Eubacteriales bacterium]
MRLIFLGAPGVGKGTLASLLANEKDLVHISTGSMLRQQIADHTELGKEAKSYMDKGELVPSELVSSILAASLKNLPEEQGYILDGYPRSLDQAEYLDQLLAELKTPLDAVVLVEIPTELIINRLSARVTCADCSEVYNLNDNPPKKEGICDKCGGKLIQRDDDKPEVIKQRLEVYEANTKPLIDYYEKKELLVRVDNSSTPEQGLHKLLAALAD